MFRQEEDVGESDRPGARSPDDRGMLAVAQGQTPQSDRKTLTLGIDTKPPRVTGLGIRFIRIGITGFYFDFPIPVS